MSAQGRATRLGARLLQAAAALALALSLAGCERGSGDALTPPNNGVASSLHLNALMDAAFGSQQQVIDTQQVRWRANLMLPPAQEARLPSVMLPASEPLAPLPPLTAASHPLPVALQRTAVVTIPREVVRLNDTRAVLVFESVPADGEGRPARRQTSQAVLGAVFYSRAAAGKNSPEKPRAAGEEQWQVSRFLPYVDAVGYEGSAGDSQVYKLAPERYLLTFESESCWQGTCGSWLHGYLLQPEGMALAWQSRLAGNNRAAYADCDARLSPQRSGPRQRRRPAAADPATPASAAASAAIDSHSCFDVRGEVHPISREAASADVSIRFKGLVSTVRGERQTVQETQLFRLNDGLYEQVDGGPNPVPEF